MPRPEINDYVFYKIVNDELPEYIYIGSTACFSKRKKGHKDVCNNPNDKHYYLKLYQIIRENGGWDKWLMVIIDKLDQSTLLDARIKEEKLMKEYNGNLNMQRAHRTDEEKKEYYQENKGRAKEYKQKNKKDISEKKKKYHEANKEVLNKQSKIHYQANKEDRLEKHKKYYETNKETISEKTKEKMTCKCGAIFRKDSIRRHEKSLKHQQFCQPIDLSIT
tara:strand:- start:13 stop:672 length:660 start_codon:yes stop_codon:yes gene_type:complete